MICQTGGSVQARIAEERENAHAQIRTMLDEQRRTIIAECNEKVLHHELLAAHAEQDRKVLQEELLRQQQEFREVHQQDLMKHLELQKFQNSAFDEFTQQKFIEDQKTIMELSGRLQELQNEVNFMNDSKDFMDAESTCSGNPHVTSPPGLFPRHPPFEGMLRPLFSSQRQDEEPPNIWDTSGISRNVFAHPQASSSAPYPQELNSSTWNTWKKTTEEPNHMSIAEKSGRPERDSVLRCQSGPSASRRGFTRQPENSKRAHLSAPALQTPPKFNEKTPREGRKERILRREREKKSAKFWASHPSGPTFPAPTFGPHPSGSHFYWFGAPPFWPPPFWPPPFWLPPFWPPPFWPPPFWPPLFLGWGPHPSGTHPSPPTHDNSTHTKKT